MKLSGVTYAMARDLVVHGAIGIKSLPGFPSRARELGFTDEVSDALGVNLG